jgi:hypothetical protein
MNLPPEPKDDRRAVPRHIRDGEHDMLEDTLGSNPAVAAAPGRRSRLWIYIAVVLAAGAGLWFMLSARV